MARPRITDEGRIKQGRGQGTGADYIPWIQVRDFGSKGRVTRDRGWVTGRVHHLLSDLETKVFYIKEWLSLMRPIVDVQEQFPLPLEETLRIAAHLHLRHPTVDGMPVVMTTDAVVTVAGPDGPIRTAYAVKYENELADPRAQPNLEIARRWHEAAGEPWGLVTERDVDHTLAANVEKLHEHRDLSDRLPVADAARIIQVLTALVQGQRAPLRDLTTRCDDRLGYGGKDAGASLAVAYHLIVTRQWRVDMGAPIDPSLPLDIRGVRLQTTHHRERAS